MSRRAHVVGNGPSCVEYEKIDPSDFSIGCNIPKREVDVSTMADIKFVNVILEDKLVPNIPVIISNDVLNFLEENNTSDQFNIIGNFEIRKGIYSSSHYAAYWLLSQGYDEIHLWGLDSLYENHMFSYTDKIKDTPAKHEDEYISNIIKGWKAYWRRIENEYPTVKFIFHKPSKKYDVRDLRKTYLFNDTSDYHNGCKKVVESYGDEIDVKIKTKDSLSVLDIDYRNVKKVILNGEGTMHHNQSTAINFLKGLRKAQKAGCETEIHNTVWESMKHEYDDVLKKCSLITVRESISQQELL